MRPPPVQDCRLLSRPFLAVVCLALLRALGVSGAAAIVGLPAPVEAHTSATRLPPDAFEAVKAALSVVSLSDRENGEILGTAFDLVERPDPPERLDPPERHAAAEPGDAAHRLAVILAPGALDKLRRASEFRRVEPAADAAGTRPAFVYVRDEPPAIRVIVTVAPVKAIIEVSRRP